MGILTAKKFLQHIDVDQKLQAQVNDAAWNIEPMVVIATSNGFAVTSHDLQSAIDELWGVLSEEDLRNAAGGGGDKAPKAPKAPKDDTTDTTLSSCSFYYGQ